MFRQSASFYDKKHLNSISQCLTYPDLRHTFATLALQNGVDIKTVSGMLGHFSAGFTLDTYAHVTTAAQKEAAKAMERVLTAAL